MARVKNPILFSAHFSVPPEALVDAGLIDPFLNVDVPLFIDPVLLKKSSNETIRTLAFQRFRKHFEVLVRMLVISEAENDAAWKDAALACWQTLGPGGQARYTDAAIQTSLMLRTAFKLALRQTEGLMTSVLTLMGLTLSVPDHTTVSRRAVTLPLIQPASVPHGSLHVLIDSTGLQVYGAGQWLEAKHGAKSRRTWRKLHLAVDAASGMIVAQTLTNQDTDDPSQVGPLLDQIDDPIGQVTADGAYDGAPTYQTIAAHGDGIEVVIPPRATAIPTGELDPPTQRDRHLAMITQQGRLAWQVATGYGQRSLVETTKGRYKTLIGPRLRARGFAAQQTEVAIGVAVLNRMLVAGRPNSVRRQPVIA